MRGIYGLILAFGLQAGADNLPVFDKDFTCTEMTTAERYIKQFSIDIASFGGLELCNSAVDSKKLFNDLSLIEGGQFSGEAKNVFIGNHVDRNNYFSWMMENTRGVRRGDDLPTATAYNRGGYFTMQDGWTQLSSLGRVGVIIHEARHTEGYSHVECTHGPYQDTGSAGCDESVGYGGSHAIEMEYYARVVVQGANFHPVYQSMARLMLLARANFVFNEYAMSSKDGLLAHTAEGLLRVKDGIVSPLRVPTEIPLTAQLKRSSFGATLLDLSGASGAAWAVDLNNSKSEVAIDDGYSYFKLLKKSAPTNLRDVEEFDLGTKRHIFALDMSGNIASFIYGDGNWSSLTKVNATGFATLSPEGKAGIYARFDDGSFCTLKDDGTACLDSAKPWPAGIKNFSSFKGETISLGEDGVVRHKDGSPLTELQSLKVLDLVAVPEYNAFE